MKKPFLYAALLLLALGACRTIPKEAYFNRGDPEALLDSSSEVVNVNLRSRSSVSELAKWINRDQPSRAELHCAAADRLCQQARKVLAQFAVPTTATPGANQSVSLIYERVLARDCQNRYIDNHNNPYELNHPTFGCSIASNIVQMVSDKRQFTSPPLMDNTSAEKASQALAGYNQSETYQPANVSNTFQSLLQEIQQSSGGGGR